MTNTDSVYRDHQYSRMLLGLGSFIALGCGVAVGAVFGSGARLAVWIVLEVAVLVAARKTRLDITIDGEGVRLHPAFIAWEHIRDVEVLDSTQFKAALTTAAHPNDYRRIRHTRAGIRVRLNDPTDPHPSWVASVHNPDAVARVLALRVGA